MNAIDLLEQQHEEVNELFHEIRVSEGDEEKRMLFDELADKLAAHTIVEEKLFYPAAYTGAIEDLLREAVEEHLAIKRTLADLMELDCDDEQFDAKLRVLMEQVEHHVEEEEGELFKKVKKELDAPRLENLGDEMLAMYLELMEGHPSAQVPEETEEAAPIKKAQRHKAQHP
jgi:uncharacterized protein YecA (UPF0149 family)